MLNKKRPYFLNEHASTLKPIPPKTCKELAEEKNKLEKQKHINETEKIKNETFASGLETEIKELDKKIEELDIDYKKQIEELKDKIPDKYKNGEKNILKIIKNVYKLHLKKHLEFNESICFGSKWICPYLAVEVKYLNFYANLLEEGNANIRNNYFFPLNQVKSQKEKKQFKLEEHRNEINLLEEEIQQQDIEIKELENSIANECPSFKLSKNLINSKCKKLKQKIKKYKKINKELTKESVNINHGVDSINYLKIKNEFLLWQENNKKKLIKQLEKISNAIPKKEKENFYKDYHNVIEEMSQINFSRKFNELTTKELTDLKKNNSIQSQLFKKRFLKNIKTLKKNCK